MLISLAAVAVILVGFACRRHRRHAREMRGRVVSVCVAHYFVGTSRVSVASGCSCLHPLSPSTTTLLRLLSPSLLIYLTLKFVLGSPLSDFFFHWFYCPAVAGPTAVDEPPDVIVSRVSVDIDPAAGALPGDMDMVRTDAARQPTDLVCCL